MTNHPGPLHHLDEGPLAGALAADGAVQGDAVVVHGRSLA